MLAALQYCAKLQAPFKKSIAIFLRFSPFFPIDDTGVTFLYSAIMISIGCGILHVYALSQLLSKPDLSQKCQMKICNSMLITFAQYCTLNPQKIFLGERLMMIFCVFKLCTTYPLSTSKLKICLTTAGNRTYDLWNAISKLSPGRYAVIGLAVQRFDSHHGQAYFSPLTRRRGYRLTVTRQT